MIDRRKYDLALPYPLLDRRTQTAAANWNYRFGGFTLTGISAFQDVDLTRDLQGYEFPETEKAFSQEVRLAYTGPGPLSGVAGIYIRNSDFTRDVSYRADRNEIGTDTLAGFGELTWRATDRLDFTGGVRVTRDRSSIDYNLPAFMLSFSDAAEFHSTQPKFSIGYRLNDVTRVYALISQGYKPGGFQHAIVNPANPTDFDAYDAETAWNYEVGFRTSLFNRSFDLSAALYHIVSEDKQIYVGPVGQQVIRNAGEAESTGIEIEAQWRASNKLTFRATANYGRSEFTDFVDTAAGVDYTGNRVPYAPDFTATLSARYVLDQRLFGATTALLGGMRYASRTYFDEANTLSQGAFGVYDAAIELNWDSGIGLKLFANNITDEIYREYSYRSGPQILSLASEGRLIGLTLSAKY
jgi:pesticin/yersiniabactin receptor